jgi:hypothetical protein
MILIPSNHIDSFQFNAQEHNGKTTKSFIFKVKPPKNVEIHIGDKYVLCEDDEYREYRLKKDLVLALVIIRCVDDLLEEERNNYLAASGNLGKVKFHNGGISGGFSIEGLDSSYADVNVAEKEHPPTINFTAFVSASFFSSLNENYLSNKNIENIIIGANFYVNYVKGDKNLKFFWDIQEDIDRHQENVGKLEIVDSVGKPIEYEHSGGDRFDLSGSLNFREISVTSHNLGIHSIEVNFRPIATMKFYSKRLASVDWSIEKQKEREGLFLLDFYQELTLINKSLIFFFLTIIVLLVLILIFK